MNLKGKRAVSYVRVSTTEQKEMGGSLEYQSEQIKSFCQRNEIELVEEFVEGYSSKTFNRPVFSQLEKFVIGKKSKSRIDLVLVLKWDRLSRNSVEAQILISRYMKMGVELNAVQSWKDLKNSEDWLSQNIELAFAEYENRKKSERVKMGILAAKKEGRYTSKPPLGYMPSKNVFGKAVMIPHPEYSNLIIQLLKEYNSGMVSQSSLVYKYSELGLKLSKSNLSRILSNELYAGLITYEDEEGSKVTIKSMHEALIPESLYRQNLVILKGRKKKA